MEESVIEDAAHVEVALQCPDGVSIDHVWRNENALYVRMFFTPSTSRSSIADVRIPRRLSVGGVLWTLWIVYDRDRLEKRNDLPWIVRYARVQVPKPPTVR